MWPGADMPGPWDNGGALQSLRASCGCVLERGLCLINFFRKVHSFESSCIWRSRRMIFLVLQACTPGSLKEFEDTAFVCRNLLLPPFLG